jgi:hypothetical protein
MTCLSKGRLTALCAGIALLSACSVAQMRLPSGLAASAVRTPIEGVGGGTRGQFRAGAYRGSFTRSEQRLVLFETLVRNYGHGEFRIEGPEISSSIEAHCRMDERLLDFGVIEFKASKLAYRCDFTAEGRPFPARFELQEASSGLGGALNRHERRGELALGGEIVQFRSVHKLEGSPIEVASPIGYVFEQNGRPMGAVELNGTPIMILPSGLDAGLRRTLSVAAVGLAIFWDPANSALDD